MEENKFKRTTVTAALPYANGGVHIGHLAGVYVPADIYVRYLRLKKQEVMFIGGSDEHGVPVTIRASRSRLKTSAFRSTSTAVLHLIFTISSQATSSARSTTSTSS